jgi:hypothetical protein
MVVDFKITLPKISLELWMFIGLNFDTVYMSTETPLGEPGGVETRSH